MTLMILLIIDRIPGLHLRASEKDEIEGMDEVEIGEFAVSFAPPSIRCQCRFCLQHSLI